MKPKCKSCSSCGMPMEKAEDHSLGDTQSEFCQYCTDKAGKLLPFDQILKANADYFQESQGLTPQADRRRREKTQKSRAKDSRRPHPGLGADGREGGKAGGEEFV